MKTNTGPTPGGGDKSTVQFVDAAGKQVDSAKDATAAEVTEYLDGTVIARHHMAPGAAAVAFSDPGDAMSEPDAWDTTKDTWDVYVNDDGMFTLAETVPDLLDALGLAHLPLPEQRAQVAHLMELPSWLAAPEALRTAAGEWLVATRPSG